MELISNLTRRLTNMRGVTCWFYIGGALFIADRHPATAEEVMWAAAAVAAAFMGVSGWTERPSLTQPTNGEKQ